MRPSAMWSWVVWCMCAASKLTAIAAIHTHTNTRRHAILNDTASHCRGQSIYTIYTVYINYSRLPILVTGSLLHRIKLFTLWLFLYALDEFLYTEFWNVIKELKNLSLHSLCSENLKSHDDLVLFLPLLSNFWTESLRNTYDILGWVSNLVSIPLH
jgi:hypothetical protein